MNFLSLKPNYTLYMEYMIENLQRLFSRALNVGKLNAASQGVTLLIIGVTRLFMKDTWTRLPNRSLFLPIIEIIYYLSFDT